MSFEIHPDGHATIGGVPFCAGPSVRVFDHRSPRGGVRVRGVQLDMANGLELSVMFGTSNYCEARDDPEATSSVTAEVALFGLDENMVGDPAGWVDAATVLALIPLVAAADPRIDAREFLALRSAA